MCYYTCSGVRKPHKVIEMRHTNSIAVNGLQLDIIQIVLI